MSLKRNYILGIINDKTILEFEGVISKYASMSRASSWDYVLRDGETGEMLVTVRYGGQIAIKFELKSFNADFGYCKGFKPNFRPIEGNSIEDLNINPEVIYITADSSENLIKLKDFLTDKVKEIDSGLEVEFTWFFKDE